MAHVSTGLVLRVEWLEAPDVSTPELAATWARYELWCGSDCITQVETSDHTFRRGVYGALFPLAEWIVENWWLLATSVRPSAISQTYWTWPNVHLHAWLRHHNLRAAGNGMAWPNLTVVPEGGVTCLRWSADSGNSLGTLRFVSAGTTFVPSDELLGSLANIVEAVLDRLTDAGLPKTQLAEDWTALGQLDQEEKDFCAIAARLGLDPFSVPDELADGIVEAAELLPASLADDFFDNADAGGLLQAARWTRRASGRAESTSRRARSALGPLWSALSSTAEMPLANTTGRPWEVGYALARRVRTVMNVQPAQPVKIGIWVALGTTSGPSGGIQGVAAVAAERCGLVLSESWSSPSSRAFAQARALGRTLAAPGRTTFMLSAAGSQDEQAARAFAAELLAPAVGIRELLGGDRPDDVAFESIARRFGVSPLVVQHQYDNQLTQISS